MAQFFRKKPVVIQAFRYGIDYRPDWFQDKVSSNDITTFDKYCIILTLEGDMKGDKGDWIIQGVKGEIYPCKPDIFEATYESPVMREEKEELLSLVKSTAKGALVASERDKNAMKKAMEAIGLLNSMVAGGEDHSETSRKLVEGAVVDLLHAMQFKAEPPTESGALSFLSE